MGAVSKPPKAAGDHYLLFRQAHVIQGNGVFTAQLPHEALLYHGEPLAYLLEVGFEQLPSRLDPHHVQALPLPLGDYPQLAGLSVTRSVCPSVRLKERCLSHIEGGPKSGGGEGQVDRVMGERSNITKRFPL